MRAPERGTARALRAVGRNCDAMERTCHRRNGTPTPAGHVQRKAHIPLLHTADHNVSSGRVDSVDPGNALTGWRKARRSLSNGDCVEVAPSGHLPRSTRQQGPCGSGLPLHRRRMVRVPRGYEEGHGGTPVPDPPEPPATNAITGGRTRRGKPQMTTITEQRRSTGHRAEAAVTRELVPGSCTWPGCCTVRTWLTSRASGLPAKAVLAAAFSCCRQVRLSAGW